MSFLYAPFGLFCLSNRLITHQAKSEAQNNTNTEKDTGAGAVADAEAERPAAKGKDLCQQGNREEQPLSSNPEPLSLSEPDEKVNNGKRLSACNYDREQAQDSQNPGLQ
ncbi:uncharacterized protein DMAD_09628 [Drosophila madeirensis]|uniref:Uncharacterized protein n=1 Tax=Drosophila madeirensis TaxID=30013 RepID=A0AAU9EYF3_DROMD